VTRAIDILRADVIRTMKLLGCAAIKDLDGSFIDVPAEWTARLQSAGIPASPVRTFEDVVDHPQSAVRQMFPTLHHPTAGAHRVTGTPVKLSDTPGGPGLPAPALGEHTRETLADLLGLGADEVTGLFARGIAYEAEDRR